MTPDVLPLLLQYCRYHRVAGHSDKERKAFDERFIRLDTRRLCELTSAADRWGLGTAPFCDVRPQTYCAELSRTVLSLKRSFVARLKCIRMATGRFGVSAIP